ncbi:hypothetical protein GPUN_0397 [Glaciecola punicea ACAM 611]|jgi:multidrug efflux pump subunit AcrB|uniref:Uncharacterized protein n=1 Tax=Glaciecola punicea ACAM 611 TaxID=1121923 RepID=H5T8A3_9ALTE|nr:hypothetical protein [Glaciecola punicea]OFA29907.1 hypothetical protein BAE46_12815 [Glaciecola punicea]GAB54544.1 hypothetical protein GPUN_0397 [Glaciecola punicea ACAM 611]
MIYDGSSKKKAANSAALLRLRGIFLTTATTSLGIMPMLFETSTQAQFLIPALMIIREDIRAKIKRFQTV